MKILHVILIESSETTVKLKYTFSIHTFHLHRPFT